AVLISAVDDDQGLDVDTRFPDAVAAMLEALLHGQANAHQLRAGLLDDVAQAAHGLSVGHEVIHDEHLIVGADPVLGDQQRDLLFICIGKNIALIEAAFDVIALGLLRKHHGNAHCPRTDGSQSNAAGLRREYQGDLAGIKAFFEFLRDLLHQLRIHTMVEEAIHLHNVAGKDLPLFHDALFHKLHVFSSFQQNMVSSVSKKYFRPAVRILKLSKKFQNPV